MQLQSKPNDRWNRFAVLLMLALVLLASCGRAEQQAEQTSPAPLSPAPATLEATTPTSAVQTTAVLIRPTPNDTQMAASATVALIETSIAASDNEYNATATAKAAWAQTPEPTILPPADTPRLRDLWPAAPQQAAAPTRLYLRSFGDGQFDPDTFWEVRLSDAQLRRLPAIEKPSVDQSAQVSPDGRFLAYVTGSTKTMERTLRLLDLTQDTDRVLAKFVTSGSPRCFQPFAWSPDSHSLAVITLRDGQNGPLSLLQLHDNVAGNQTPQTLAEFPSPLKLLGWLDAERLLVVHWKPKAPRIQLLGVDRHSHITLISEPESEQLSCANLSPDRQALIYNQARQIKRLWLGTGQEETFPWRPDEFFWVEEGRTLLRSQFSTDRRVWLGSLDQLQDQSQKQPGIFLSPPYQAAYQFGIIGVSPDNRLLVACEIAPYDNPRIHAYDSRTWLYSIPDDHWTLIHTNSKPTCDLVLGWSSVRSVR